MRTAEQVPPARTRRMTASFAAVLAVGVLALGCGGDSGDGAPSDAGGQADAGGLTTLDVGIIGIAADAPIWVAMERGFFEEEGLKIETHTAAGGAAIVPAVVSGDFDIGTGGLLSVISAGARGLPLKVLAEDGAVLSHATAATSLDDEEHLGNGIFASDESIRTAEDLEGGTIAVTTLKSINTALASAWLEKHGVDPSSVEFLEVPFPDQPVALEAGRVDAAFLIEPFLTEALENGAHAVGYPLAEVTPGLTLAGYFVTEEFAQGNPEVLAGFQRAILRANEYVDTHEDAYREAIIANTDIPEETVQKMRLRSFEPRRDDSLEVMARLAAKYGVLDQEPPVADLRLDPTSGDGG